MDFETLLGAPDALPVQVGLIGSGEFGVSLVGQARASGRLRVAALCDLDTDRALDACRRAGLSDDAVQVCTGRAESLRAFESGRHVIVEDAQLLVELPLDVVVEATGNPQAAASNACAAIEAGKHLVMVKNLDMICLPPSCLLTRHRSAPSAHPHEYW